MRSDDEDNGEEEEESQSKEKEQKKGKNAVEGPAHAQENMIGNGFIGEEKSFAQVVQEGKKEL